MANVILRRLVAAHGSLHSHAQRTWQSMRTRIYGQMLRLLLKLVVEPCCGGTLCVTSAVPLTLR